MRPETIPRFVLRVFLWMPVCFAAWYATAPYHAALAGPLSYLITDVFQPGIVKAFERAGIFLTFVTRIEAQSAQGGTGLLVIEVNPLMYTYGLALFLALMLASRAKWRAIVAGAVALLPFEAWGIAFDFLAQVGVKLGPEVSAKAGFSGAQREAIALGYQLGSLIFPSLLPVALWAVFDRRFLEAVMRGRGRTPVE